MQKEYNFAVEEIKRVEFSDYDENEFAIARLGYISTKPNSHHIGIDEDCLRASAPSALGAWIVADMVAGDASTHTDTEHIVGLIPKEQEVEFVKDDDGYLRAYADAIISKRYAADFCEIFEEDNHRAVSIEAKFTMRDDDNAESFDIKGVTVLGATVRPSCPESDIEFIRFSEQDAEQYYNRVHKFADKPTYKVDKSKDAMSDADWSDIDKSALRDKIMDATNRAKLVKDVYMVVEDGWEDAPSEHLKYPVMAFDGDTLVYYRKALSSALAYAKQNDETAVVDKIEKIYNKLDLNDEGKEENMEEIKEVEMTEVVPVEEPAVDMTETENPEKRDEKMAYGDDEKMTEYEKSDKSEDEESKDDGGEEKMPADEMLAKIEQLTKDIEERDNIIMEKDAELAELRKFKQSVNEKERAMTVEGVMSEIKDYVDNLMYNDIREEGLKCDFAALDAWTNKAKAICFGAVKKTRKRNENTDTTVWGFSAPIEPITKKTSIWD